MRLTSSITTKSMIYALGICGLIPFVGIALWLWLAETFGFRNHFLLIEGFRAFYTYSAVILSFLSGSLWSHGLRLSQGATATRLLLVSNVIALIAWCAVIISGYLDTAAVALVALAFGYLSIWFVEWYLYRQFPELVSDHSRHQYFRLRSCLTVVVVIMHAVVLAKFLGVHSSHNADCERLGVPPNADERRELSPGVIPLRTYQSLSEPITRPMAPLLTM